MPWTSSCYTPLFPGLRKCYFDGFNTDLLPAVEMGLRMKKHGNELLAVIGGLGYSSPSPTVGGFYRAPTGKGTSGAAGLSFLSGLAAPRLSPDRYAALDFPDFAPHYEFVSLRRPDEYPMNEGNVVSSKGLTSPWKRSRSSSSTTMWRIPMRARPPRHGGAYKPARKPV